MLINELFTSPQTQLGNPDYSYPIKAISSNDNHLRAIVRAGKRWMEIEFARISHREDPRVLEISFEIDGSMNITGGGDAIRIFNTVLVVLDKFIKENTPPDFFIFAGEGSSRISFYRRMMLKFLPSLGYTSAGYDDLPISVQDNWWQGGSGADVFIAKRIQKESQQLDEYSYIGDYRINDYLEARGYKLIGSGKDQLAYLTPNKKFVLKIFGANMRKSNKKNIPFTKDQLMFFQWANYCAQNSTNPFLPKFIEGEGGKPWALFDLEGRRYLQIWQEHLYELDNETARDLSKLANMAGSFSSMEIAQGDVKNFLEEFGKYLRPSEKSVMRHMIRKYGAKQFQLLVKTLYDLAGHARGTGWWMDLHTGNFLQRQNGHPVIADPWVVPSRQAE